MNKSDLKFEVYAKMFIDNVPLAKRVDSRTFIGRCVMCGDSKKDKRKSRLYLVREKGGIPALIKCHNCFEKMIAKAFFKKYFPKAIEPFMQSWGDRDLSEVRDRLQNEDFYIMDEYKELTLDEKLHEFDKELVKAKKVVYKFFREYTNPITTDTNAVNYIRSRNIPEHFIRTMRLLKEEYWNYDFRYSYLRNYIMIPFMDDEDNMPYYFHARKYKEMDSRMAKYLSCPYKTDSVEVDFFLGELSVNKGQPITISEGTVDYMNLPNSISLNGIGKATPELIKYFEHRYGGQDNLIYAFDNELVDTEAKKKTKELLKMGKRVFLWSLMAKDFPNTRGIKDFNELCMKANKYQVPMDIINKYTTNDITKLAECINV